jgi:UDP-N-acetyl-D-mannosaminuronate dehydrogenase
MDTVNQLVKQMVQHKIDVRTARVLLYGIGYLHNPTTVNPMLVEVYHELLSYGMEVLVYDEKVDALQVRENYQLTVMQTEAALKVRRPLTYDHRLPATIACFDGVVLQ